MDTMNNRDPLHGRDIVMNVSSTLHDLGAFLEETLKGNFQEVEGRLQIAHVRCHELGGELFRACSEVITIAGLDGTDSESLVNELYQRCVELQGIAGKLPAGECGPVFKDANLMRRAATHIVRLISTSASRVEAQCRTVENICHTCTKMPDDCFPDNGECPYYEPTDESLPPWERDMTPEEEYDDFRRILAKKLGVEEDNTIILEAIGILQHGFEENENALAFIRKHDEDSDQLCILRDKLARSKELEESAKAVTRAVQADNERLKDFQLAKEKTIEVLMSDIKSAEDAAHLQTIRADEMQHERDEAVTEAMAVGEHSQKLLRKRENLRMLLRCEVSGQLCSYERNREDREDECECPACCAARDAGGSND
jgi:hypothetical protein